MEPQPIASTPIQVANPPIEDVSIAGRSSTFIEEWEKITNDPEVLCAVRGYRIPFSFTPPPRVCIKEPCFSRTEEKACDIEIARLLSKGAVVVISSSEDQFLSPFFPIKKSSGGMRFILNLRELNRFLDPQHFQLEDWRTVIHIMTPGSWMSKLDLEDAYLLLPITREDRRFLRFKWRSIIYEFTALPFGLSTALYVFTKIIRPVIVQLRNEGLLSVVYLDDFLLFGSSKEDCLGNLNASLSLLISLGFLVNFAKS